MSARVLILNDPAARYHTSFDTEPNIEHPRVGPPVGLTK